MPLRYYEKTQCKWSTSFLVALTTIIVGTAGCDRFAQFRIAEESKGLATPTRGKYTFAINNKDVTAEISLLADKELILVGVTLTLTNTSDYSLFLSPHEVRLGDSTGPFEPVNLEVEARPFRTLEQLVLDKNETVEVFLSTERNSVHSHPRMIWFHVGAQANTKMRFFTCDTIWFNTG